MEATGCTMPPLPLHADTARRILSYAAGFQRSRATYKAPRVTAVSAAPVFKAMGPTGCRAGRVAQWPAYLAGCAAPRRKLTQVERPAPRWIGAATPALTARVRIQDRSARRSRRPSPPSSSHRECPRRTRSQGTRSYVPREIAGRAGLRVCGRGKRAQTEFSSARRPGRPAEYAQPGCRQHAHALNAPRRGMETARPPSPGSRACAPESPPVRRR